MGWLINLTISPSVNGVERLVTYQEWADLIHKSFEKHFYIPLGTPSCFTAFNQQPLTKVIS